MAFMHLETCIQVENVSPSKTNPTALSFIHFWDGCTFCVHHTQLQRTMKLLHPPPNDESLVTTNGPLQNVLAEVQTSKVL